MSTTPQQVERSIRRYTLSDFQIAENVRLNAIQKERDRQARESVKPKEQERGKVSRDAEIELIKRQLSQLIHRVDGLKTQKA